MSDISIKLPAPFSCYEQEVVYKECMRNHAASLGHVACYDGCLQFLDDQLLCAACGCHRNFHRRITIYTPVTQTKNVNGTSSPMPVAVAPPVRGKLRKKRTSFTAEQKRRLMEFAERVGWKPKNAEKEVVNNFCMEMGISRRMFVVWLSNNRRHAIAMPQNKLRTSALALGV